MRAIKYILRAFWLLLLSAWIWSLATGRAVQPLHSFNIILSAAVFIGTLTIWFSAHTARLISSICGVVTAAMMGFQFLIMMNMFTSDTHVQLRASLGPFEFEGIVAQLIIWLPPLLLLGLSAVLLFDEIRYRLSQIQGRSQPSKSA
jgi:hypothetical protein